LTTKELALADDLPRRGKSSKMDFAAVVHEHWNAVYRMIHHLCGNAHAAEDLTQEAFLRALDRIDKFEIGTNMRAWLLRIATNAFFDEQRKRKRAKSQALIDDLPTNSSPPGTDLETVEQAALARAALEELTELTRLVFHLRVEEDLSFREIAELAGTTEQSARWHMHQARTKLLARLGEKSSTGGEP
jgi:RNA polymerase sigma-70 factor (ECF subfamily)